MSEVSYTIDTLKGGAVRIFQPKRGYRFSIDAVLLAHFINPKKNETSLLEIGAGSGVVSFLLAHLHPHLNITAVDDIHPVLEGVLSHPQFRKSDKFILIFNGGYV